MDESWYEERLAGFFIGCVGPIAVAGLLVGVRGRISVADVALALVLLVVLAAEVGGRQSGVIAAVVSAASLDFFHIRPYLSLKVASRDDVITLVLLLVVGVAVGGVAVGRRKAVDKAVSLHDEVVRLHRVAEFVASGADPEDVRLSVEAEVTAALALTECTYESVPVGSVGLPRLERGGAVVGGGHFSMAPNGFFELPAQGIELAVVGRGAELGRFVCIPTKGVGVDVEHRLTAIALADQLGAVLVASTR